MIKKDIYEYYFKIMYLKEHKYIHTLTEAKFVEKIKDFLSAKLNNNDIKDFYKQIIKNHYIEDGNDLVISNKHQLMEIEKIAENSWSIIKCEFEKLGIKTINRFDDPDYFLNFHNKVNFVCCMGDITLLRSKNKVSIVGSREANDFEKNLTNKLCKDLVNKNYIVVSGAAKGIDQTAHKATIDCNGKTIAVLPLSILSKSHSKNVLLPIVESGGLVISQWPPIEKKFVLNQFVERNKTIAHLSKVVFATSAPKITSGTMYTIIDAYDEDIEYCLPDYLPIMKPNYDIYYDMQNHKKSAKNDFKRMEKYKKLLDRAHKNNWTSIEYFLNKL